MGFFTYECLLGSLPSASPNILFNSLTSQKLTLNSNVK
jgi:hypothetical protein